MHCFITFKSSLFLCFIIASQRCATIMIVELYCEMYVYVLNKAKKIGRTHRLLFNDCLWHVYDLFFNENHSSCVGPICVSNIIINHITAIRRIFSHECLRWTCLRMECTSSDTVQRKIPPRTRGKS